MALWTGADICDLLAPDESTLLKESIRVGEDAGRLAWLGDKLAVTNCLTLSYRLLKFEKIFPISEINASTRADPAPVMRKRYAGHTKTIACLY